MRKYAAIRPRDAETARGSRSPTSQTSEIKRRRTTVSVACNGCRRKKIRCDGQRPTCSACGGNTEGCSYRDESQLSQESQLVLLEVIRLLNTSSKEAAFHKVRSLRNEVDASVVLSTLRGGKAADPKSLNLSSTATFTMDPFLATELAPQNPNVYPFHATLDFETLQETIYQQLVRPNNGNSESTSAENEEGTAVRSLCDDQLAKLDISYWSNVPICNDVASHAISLYLETDHPLLGFFDPGSFVSDLIHGQTNYCSSILVNALLYWACQLNGVQDADSAVHADQFCAEAESLWQDESSTDSILNMAAALFLSLGYMGQGREPVVLSYIKAASDMAIRMGLFGPHVDLIDDRVSQMSPRTTRAYQYAAWGAFNWINHMSLFYRQPELQCPQRPPHLAVPRTQINDEVGGPRHFHALQSDPDSAYMGGVFSHLCDFWLIMHEVAIMYTRHNGSLLAEQRTLRFAEYKFRELLAWGNRLPKSVSHSKRNPHHVQVLHMWFHAAVLDIFRHSSAGPLRHERLRTFASLNSSADKVCAASASQLKQLIVNYRLHFSTASYSVLWHIALIYLANELLNQPKEETWSFHFLLCIYGYERLHPCWRVTRTLSTGLLSLALRKDVISSSTALRILGEINNNGGINTSTGDIRATFMMDLDLAKSDPGSASAEKLAADFGQNVLLQGCTTIFEEHNLN